MALVLETNIDFATEVMHGGSACHLNCEVVQIDYYQTLSCSPNTLKRNNESWLTGQQAKTRLCLSITKFGRYPILGDNDSLEYYYYQTIINRPKHCNSHCNPALMVLNDSKLICHSFATYLTFSSLNTGADKIQLKDFHLSKRFGIEGVFFFVWL